MSLECPRLTQVMALPHSYPFFCHHAFGPSCQAVVGRSTLLALSAFMHNVLVFRFHKMNEETNGANGNGLYDQYITHYMQQFLKKNFFLKCAVPQSSLKLRFRRFECTVRQTIYNNQLNLNELVMKSNVFQRTFTQSNINTTVCIWAFIRGSGAPHWCQQHKQRQRT